MATHQIEVIIPEDRRLIVEVPETFRSGPATLLLQAEVGASLVNELLGARQRCLLHAINACEIYYDLYRRDGQEIADGNS